MRRHRPPLWPLLLPLLALAPPPAAAQQDPVAVLSHLRETEAGVRSGDVRYRTTSRTVLWDGDVDEDAALAQLQERGRPFGETSARLRFIRDAWLIEGEFTPAPGEGERQVNQFGGFEGVRRTVRRSGAEIQARIEPDGGAGAVPTPEAALRGRLWWEARPVQWREVVEEAGALVLHGEQDRRQVELRLDPQRGHRVTAIVLRSRNSRGEITVIQSLRLTYEGVGDGIPYPTEIAQLFVSRLGDNSQATRHLSRVEAVTLNEDVPEEELKIALPRGALVTDARGEVPVFYHLTTAELPIEEVRDLAARKLALLQGGATFIGDPAPPLALPDLDGEEVTLAGHRGGVVVLLWFASWSEPSNAAAPLLEREIWQRFREQGVTVLAINTGEREGEPLAQARAFRERHGLSVPVLMDPDGRWLDFFGGTQIPTTAIVDQAGVLRYRTPEFNAASVQEAIQRLLEPGR